MEQANGCLLISIAHAVSSKAYVAQMTCKASTQDKCNGLRLRNGKSLATVPVWVQPLNFGEYAVACLLRKSAAKANTV